MKFKINESYSFILSKHSLTSRLQSWSDRWASKPRDDTWQ